MSEIESGPFTILDVILGLDPRIHNFNGLWILASRARMTQEGLGTPIGVRLRGPFSSKTPDYHRLVCRLADRPRRNH